MKQITFIILITISIHLIGQEIELDWASSIGSTSIDQGRAIAIDSKGNTYIAGMFIGTTDFDPGSGTHELTTNGFNDGFVMKLDQNGKFKWAHNLGGIAQDWYQGMVIDEQSNVYLTGFFSQSADFNPSSSTHSLTSNGNNDIFIQKLDSNGNFQWAVSLGGNDVDQGLSIALDNTNNVLVTGYFRGNVDFDPGSSSFMLSSNGLNDIFLLRLDANGNFIHATSIGGPFSDIGYSVACDEMGNTYTTGAFKGSVDFDPGAALIELDTFGNSDIFIQKLDKNGNFKWAQSIGSASHDLGRDIVYDVFGNINLIGYFSDSADFDPGPGIQMMISKGNEDLFVFQMENDGDLVWAKSIGGQDADQGYAIHSDASGDLYFTGIFEDTVDFDPSINIFELSAAGGTDFFMEKFKRTGDFEWVKSYGDMNQDFGYDVHVNLDKEVVLTGSFSNTINVDPGVSNTTLTSNGSHDCFILKQKLKTTGVAAPISTNKVFVYPNPSEGIFTISLDQIYREVTIEVNDNSGRRISTDEFVNSDLVKSRIDGKNGLYFIKVIADQEYLGAVKILKQ